MAARKSKILSQVESIAHPQDAMTRPTPPGRSRPLAVEPSARRASVGQRWKFRRNLVIYIANQHGASQRMLADVFDLPHSRIAAILKELRQKYGQPPQRLLE